MAHCRRRAATDIQIGRFFCSMTIRTRAAIVATAAPVRVDGNLPLTGSTRTWVYFGRQICVQRVRSAVWHRLTG